MNGRVLDPFLCTVQAESGSCNQRDLNDEWVNKEERHREEGAKNEKDFENVTARRSKLRGNKSENRRVFNVF